MLNKRKCKNTQEWGVCGVVMNFVKYIFSEIGEYIDCMYVFSLYYYGIRPVAQSFSYSSYYDAYSYFFIMLVYSHQSFFARRKINLLQNVFIYEK